MIFFLALGLADEVAPVVPDDLDGGVVGLGAAALEQHAGHAGRGQGEDALGEFDGGFVSLGKEGVIVR